MFNCNGIDNLTSAFESRWGDENSELVNYVSAVIKKLGWHLPYGELLKFRQGSDILWLKSGKDRAYLHLNENGYIFLTTSDYNTFVDFTNGIIKAFFNHNFVYYYQGKIYYYSQESYPSLAWEVGFSPMYVKQDDLDRAMKKAIPDDIIIFDQEIDKEDLMLTVLSHIRSLKQKYEKEIAGNNLNI
jgi:hypothetical protein